MVGSIHNYFSSRGVFFTLRRHPIFEHIIIDVNGILETYFSQFLCINVLEISYLQPYQDRFSHSDCRYNHKSYN